MSSFSQPQSNRDRDSDASYFKSFRWDVNVIAEDLISGERTLLRIANTLASAKERIVMEAYYQLSLRRYPDIFYPANFPNTKILTGCSRILGKLLDFVLLGIANGMDESATNKAFEEAEASVVSEWVSLFDPSYLDTPINVLVEGVQVMKNTTTSLLSGEEVAEAKRYFDYVITSLMKKLSKLATAVIAYAEEVFEDTDTVRNWLTRPNGDLAGKIPLDLLDTKAGTEQVEEVLTRIEYGIFS